MEAYDAIITRRSVPKVREVRPPRSDIERLLEAAVRAPTHHITEPWRFIVMTGAARAELGEAWARGIDREDGTSATIADKVLRAPVIIAVIERPKTHLPKVVEVEEHYATGAAIQNILLAAHALGLGAMIRTGAAATLDEVRAYLEVGPNEHIAGLIYVGVPAEGDELRRQTRRTGAAEITEWRGWH